ncbi:unnamed protein product [Allacma fusca]|uniref:Uncharacterized protein n=1 Tax=Allacma fusca TaxID=39272 RepID=A0A8J2PIJ5_9HEXA|nr:unnamed protein product [Allacma fusca]
MPARSEPTCSGHFINKLEGARAGGITSLTEAENPLEWCSSTAVEENRLEDTLLPESQFLYFAHLQKDRISLMLKRVPNGMISSFREPGPCQPWSSSSGSHLHKQLMSLRLQRRTGVVDQPEVVAKTQSQLYTLRSYLLMTSQLVDDFGGVPCVLGTSSQAFDCGRHRWCHFLVVLR